VVTTDNERTFSVDHKENLSMESWETEVRVMIIEVAEPQAVFQDVTQKMELHLSGSLKSECSRAWLEREQALPPDAQRSPGLGPASACMGPCPGSTPALEKISLRQEP
jgi:hypothetical protein